MLELGVIAILVLLNGAFSLSEAGVLASRRSRLQEQAREGIPGATAALKITESPVRFLSTVQIGITLIGIISGAFGGAALADDVAEWIAQAGAPERVARPLALTLVIVGIAYVSLVLGELVPKRIGLEHPELVARAAAGPMSVFSSIAAPLVRFLTFSTNVLLRPFGVGPRRAETVSEEEIRGMIRLGSASGVLGATESAVIERVLTLADRKVTSLMIPRQDVEWIDADATPADLIRLLRVTRFTHFPVCRGGLDDLLGVVEVRDLVRAGLSQGPIRLESLLEPPLHVPESTAPLRALDLFKERRVDAGFVTDEHGTIEGMLRLVDIVEAVVGDLAPEAEREPLVVRRDDGSLLLDGLFPVAMLGEALGEVLPSLENLSVQSVGGLMIHELGRVPVSGDAVVLDSWRLEVVDMDGRRVDKILASRAPASTEGRSPEE